jgi:DNA-binding Xre family transcriptional regulator
MTIDRQEVRVNRSKSSSESTQKVGVQELKLSKPKESKQFTTVDLWETHIDRSSTSGEHPQKVSVQDLKLTKLEYLK